MFQRVKAAFDTPEGWAVVLGLLWATLAHFFSWPAAQFTIPGFGTVSAGMFLVFGVPLVFAKMGWMVPFQPVTTAKLDEREVKAAGGTPIALLVALLLAASLACLAYARPSQAATPAQGAAERWSAGVIPRMSWYDADGATTQSTFDPAVAIVYSGTENFSLQALADLNTSKGGAWGSYGVGLNSAAVGIHAGDALRIQVGVTALHYWGTVPAWVSHRNAARANTRVSWVLARDSLHRPAAYLQAGVDVDPANGNCRRKSLAILFPLWKPKPVAP